MNRPIVARNFFVTMTLTFQGLSTLKRLLMNISLQIIILIQYEFDIKRFYSKQPLL